MDAVRQSTRGPVRWQRQLTDRQRRKRLEAMLDEIRALGAAYQLTAGQLRWRLLGWSSISRRRSIAGRIPIARSPRTDRHADLPGSGRRPPVAGAQLGAE